MTHCSYFGSRLRRRHPYRDRWTRKPVGGRVSKMRFRRFDVRLTPFRRRGGWEDRSLAEETQMQRAARSQNSWHGRRSKAEKWGSNAWVIEASMDVE